MTLDGLIHTVNQGVEGGGGGLFPESVLTQGNLGTSFSQLNTLSIFSANIKLLLSELEAY